METTLLAIVLASISWTIVLTVAVIAAVMTVNNRFDAVNNRFDAVNGRIDDLRRDMDNRFDTVNNRFDAVNDKIDALRELVIQLQGKIESARE